MSKNTLIHKFVSDPDEVAAFFQALIEGFKNRKITVTSEVREQTVVPAEIIEMTVEAVQRKGRIRLNVSASWSEVEPYPKRNLFTDMLVTSKDEVKAEAKSEAQPEAKTEGKAEGKDGS
ncbi:MAG: amphi-Trp domain-containing protein [Deltaproteobacteria bacterium]|jgi:amphi-Trp domain-containing protein|nr:amphi-Trp domain-containing protein [Deltaproteobacteria bacterium]